MLSEKLKRPIQHQMVVIIAAISVTHHKYIAMEQYTADAEELISVLERLLRESDRSKSSVEHLYSPPYIVHYQVKEQEMEYFFHYTYGRNMLFSGGRWVAGKKAKRISDLSNQSIEEEFRLWLTFLP